MSLSFLRKPFARAIQSLVTAVRGGLLGITCAMLVLSPGFRPVFANPAGATVVHGQADITAHGQTLTVRNTPGAIINWQDFSIDAGELTEFIQQHADSAVLNRVVGGDLSEIHGALRSNGNVFLINPNGLVVGKDAVIDTRGFIASTLNISDENFRAGLKHFEGDGGAIENRGVILATVGDVMLIAPRIENSGLIEAENGDVLLAAGRSVTIAEPTLEGVAFELQAPTDEVLNLGEILASGTVAAFAGTLTQSGLIEAGGVSVDETGQVFLTATTDLTAAEGSVTRSPGGLIRVESGTEDVEDALSTTWVAGEISASGDLGGRVDLLGSQVGLGDGAAVLAEGAGGGGEIHIGGSQQGQGPLRNAQNTYIAPEAEVSASATDSGDGGAVIVFAENSARILGSIAARGGQEGGDGGFIETSGLRSLEIPVLPDASAPAGQAGAWLIDPDDVVVDDFSGVNTNINGNGDPGGTGPFSPASGTVAQLDDGLLSTALDTFSSVEIDAAGSITFNAGANVQATTGAVTLTVDAGGNIVVNGTIDDVSSGALTLFLDGDGLTSVNSTIDLAESVTVRGTSGIVLAGDILTGNGAITFQNDVAVGAAVTLDSAAGGSADGAPITFQGALLLGGQTLKIDSGTMNDIQFNDVTDSGSGTLEIVGGRRVETPIGLTFQVGTLTLRSAAGGGGTGIIERATITNPIDVVTLNVDNDDFDVEIVGGGTIANQVVVSGSRNVRFNDAAAEVLTLTNGAVISGSANTLVAGELRTNGATLTFDNLDSTAANAILDTTNEETVAGADVTVNGNLGIATAVELEIGTGKLNIVGNVVDNGTANLTVDTANEVRVQGTADLDLLNVELASSLAKIVFEGDTTLDAQTLANEIYDLEFKEDLTFNGNNDFENAGSLILGDAGDDLVTATNFVNINSATVLTADLSASTITLLALEPIGTPTITRSSFIKVGMLLNSAGTLSANTDLQGAGSTVLAGQFDPDGLNIHLNGSTGDFRLLGNLELFDTGDITAVLPVDLDNHELDLSGQAGKLATLASIKDTGGSGSLRPEMDLLVTGTTTVGSIVELGFVPAAGNITFNGSVNLNLIQSGFGAYNVAYLGGGTITSYNFQGGAAEQNVQFGNDAGDSLTITGGFDAAQHALTLGGTVKSAGVSIDFANLTLVADAEIDTTNAGALPAGANIGQAAGKTIALGTHGLKIDAGTGGVVNLQTITHTTGGDLDFLNAFDLDVAGTVGVDTIQFQASFFGSADFLGAVTANSLTTGAAGMNLGIRGNGTTIEATTFNHGGTLSIGSVASDLVTLNGGVSFGGEGSTNLAGTLMTNGAILLGALSLVADGVLDSSEAGGATGPITTGAVTNAGRTLGVVPADTSDVTIFSMSGPGSLNVSSGNIVQLQSSSTLTSITTAATATELQLLGPSNTINSASLQHTGGLKIGLASGNSTSFTTGLSYTAGETLLAGGLSTSNAALTLANLEIAGTASSLNSGTGNTVLADVDLNSAPLVVTANNLNLGSLLNTGGGVLADVNLVVANSVTASGSFTADLLDLDIGDNSGVVAFQGPVTLADITTRANGGEPANNFRIDFLGGGTVLGTLNDDDFLPNQGVVIAGATPLLLSGGLVFNGPAVQLGGIVRTNSGLFETTNLTLTANSTIDTTNLNAGIGGAVRGRTWDLGGNQLIIDAGTSAVTGAMELGGFAAFGNGSASLTVSRSSSITLVNATTDIAGVNAFDLNTTGTINFLDASATGLDFNGTGAAVFRATAGTSIDLNETVFDSVADGDTILFDLNAPLIQVDNNVTVDTFKADVGNAGTLSASSPLVAASLEFIGSTATLNNVGNDFGTVTISGANTVDITDPNALTVSGFNLTSAANSTIVAANGLDVAGFDYEGFGSSVAEFDAGAGTLTLLGNVVESGGQGDEELALALAGNSVIVNADITSTGGLAELSLVTPGTASQAANTAIQTSALFLDGGATGNFNLTGNNDILRVVADANTVNLNTTGALIVGDSASSEAGFGTRAGAAVIAGGAINFDNYNYDTATASARTDVFTASDFLFTNPIFDSDTGTGSQDQLSLVLNAPVSTPTLASNITVQDLTLNLGSFTVAAVGRATVPGRLLLQGGAIGAFNFGSPTDTDSVVAGTLQSSLANGLTLFQVGDLVVDDIANLGDSQVNVAGTLSIAADGLDYNTPTGGSNRNLILSALGASSVGQIANPIFDSNPGTVDSVNVVFGGSDTSITTISTSVSAETIAASSQVGFASFATTADAALTSNNLVFGLFTVSDFSLGTNDFNNLGMIGAFGVKVRDIDDLAVKPLFLDGSQYQSLDGVQVEISAVGDVTLEGFDVEGAFALGPGGGGLSLLTSETGNITFNGVLFDSNPASGNVERLSLNFAAPAGSVSINGTISGPSATVGGPVTEVAIQALTANDGPSGAPTGLLDGIGQFGFSGTTLSFEGSHVLDFVAIQADTATLSVSRDLNFLDLVPSQLGGNMSGEGGTFTIPALSVTNSLTATAAGVVNVPGFDVNGLGAAIYQFFGGTQVDVPNAITDSDLVNGRDLSLSLAAPLLTLPANITVRDLTLDATTFTSGGTLDVDNLIVAPTTPLSLSGFAGLNLAANNSITIGSIDVHGTATPNSLLTFTTATGDISLGRIFDSNPAVGGENPDLLLTAGGTARFTGNIEGQNSGGPVASVSVFATNLEDGTGGNLLGVPQLAFTGTSLILTAGTHDVGLLAADAQNVSLTTQGPLGFNAFSTPSNTVVPAFNVTNSADINTQGDLTLPNFGAEALGTGGYRFGTSGVLTVATPVTDVDGELTLSGAEVRVQSNVSVAGLAIQANTFSQQAPLVASRFAIRGTPTAVFDLTNTGNDFDQIAVELLGGPGINLFDVDDLKIGTLTVENEVLSGFRVGGVGRVDANGLLEIAGVDFNGVGTADYTFATTAGDITFTTANFSDSDTTTAENLSLHVLNNSATGTIRLDTLVQASSAEFQASQVTDGTTGALGVGEVTFRGGSYTFDNVGTNGAALSDVNRVVVQSSGSANATGLLTLVDSDDVILGGLVAGVGAQLTGTQITLESIGAAGALVLNAPIVTAADLAADSVQLLGNNQRADFNGVINLGALDSGPAGIVSVNAGGTVNTAVAFANVGGVNLGNDISDSLVFNQGFTASGPLSLAGQVQSLAGDLALGAVNLLTNTTLSSAGGAISIGSLSTSNGSELLLSPGTGIVNLGSITGLGAVRGSVTDLRLNSDFSLNVLDLGAVSRTLVTGNGSVQTLVQNGLLEGGGTLTISDRFDWVSGAQQGPGRTVLAATGSIQAQPNPSPGTVIAPRILTSGRIFENFGTSVIGFPAQVQVNNGARVINRGVIEVLADAGFVSTQGQGFLDNFGELRKVGGTGVSRLGLTFNNSGRLSVTSGTVAIDSGGISTGEFSAAGAGVLAFSAADGATVGNVVADGARFTGGGTVRVTGRGLDVTSTTSPVFVALGTDMEWLNAQVGGTGTLNIDGRLRVGGVNGFTGRLATNLGAAQTGTPTTAIDLVPGTTIESEFPPLAQATAPVSNPSDPAGVIVLDGFSASVPGTASLTVNSLLNNGSIVSTADAGSGTQTAGSDPHLLRVLGTGGLENNGVIGADVAGLRLDFGEQVGPFVNRGRLVAARAGLAITGSNVANEGLIAAAAGRTVAAGNLGLGSGFLRGAGTVTAGTVTVGGSSVASVGTLQAGTVSVLQNGVFTQQAGQLTADRVENNGLLQIGNLLTAGVLEQNGVLSLGTVTDQPSRLAATTLNNRGRIEVLGGPGSVIDVATTGQFANTGTLAAIGGNLAVTGALLNDGVIAATANRTLGVAQLTARTGQISGAGQLNASNLTFAGTTALTVAGLTANQLVLLDNVSIERPNLAFGTGSIGTGAQLSSNVLTAQSLNIQGGALTVNTRANIDQLSANGGALTLLDLQATSVNLAGNATGSIAGSTTVSGEVAAAGGTWAFGDLQAASLNLAGLTSGTFSGTTTVGGQLASNGGTLTFSNLQAGSLNLIGGTTGTFAGTTTVGGPVSSTGGTLTFTDLQAGTLDLIGVTAGNFTGTTTITGGLSTSGGTVSFGALNAGSVTVGSGTGATFAGSTAVTGAASVAGTADLRARFAAGTVTVAQGGDVRLNDVEVVAPVTVDSGGTLRGNGTITGNVTNSGTIAPGFSPGLLGITGDFTQTSTGLLDIEVGGSGTFVAGQDFDQLNITGTATLGGTLRLTQTGPTTLEDLALAGVSPVTWGAVEGNFETVESAEGNETPFAGTITANGVQVELPECQKQNMQQQEEQRQVEEAQEESQDQVAQSVGCN